MNVTKQPSWTKRHQVAIAIVGAVLSTASYFGKDYAQEHWRELAAGIKSAEADADTAQSTARIHERLDSLSHEVDFLAKDALSVEENEKPHAQKDRSDSNRSASLSDRDHQVRNTLSKMQVQLKSLASLDKAAGASSSHEAELKSMQDDVNKKLNLTLKFAVTYAVSDVSIFGVPLAPEFAGQDAENKKMSELEKQTDAIEQRTFDLTRVIREEADRQQERYVRYAEWTTSGLSSVFVIGLLLSLMGKLTGGDGEAVGGE